MKVKIKRFDYQSELIRIGVIFILGTFSAYALIMFLEEFNSQLYSFKDILKQQGDLLLFGTIFFLFDMYALYYSIKRPKVYRATLVKKKIEKYKEKEITCMVFKIKKNEAKDFVPRKYECYTEGTNDFIEGREYLIGIKEYNWQIKNVKNIEEEQGAIKIF